MKALKMVLLVLIVLIVVIFVVSLFLPSKYKFEKSIVVNTHVEQVYKLVIDFKEWPKWDPWFQADTNMTNEFSGNPGIGHKRTFKSKTQGNGSMEVVEFVQNKSIKSKLLFQNSGKPAWIYWNFENTDSGTYVNWVVDIETGFSPIAKYMFLFSKGVMNRFLDDGLKNLKTLAETTPVMPAIAVSVIDVQEQKFIGIKKTLSMNPAEIQKFFSESYGTVMAFLTKNKINCTGPVVAFYPAYDEEKNIMDAVAAVPVANDVKVALNAGMEYYSIVAGKAVSAIHFGDYNKIGPVWNAVMDYMKANALEMNGVPYEVYLTDPGLEPDTSKWQTQVVYPVK